MLHIHSPTQCNFGFIPCRSEEEYEAALTAHELLAAQNDPPADIKDAMACFSRLQGVAVAAAEVHVAVVDHLLLTGLPACHHVMQIVRVSSVSKMRAPVWIVSGFVYGNRGRTRGCPVRCRRSLLVMLRSFQRT